MMNANIVFYWQCAGLQVTDDQLKEAAVQSGILTVDDDFLALSSEQSVNESLTLTI